MESGELNNIKTQENLIDDRFGRVFEEWERNAAKLKYCLDYPYTWQGFRTLLEHVGLSQVSDEYFAFLEMCDVQ